MINALRALLRAADRAFPAHNRGKRALQFRASDWHIEVDDSLAPFQWQVRDRDGRVLFDSHATADEGAYAPGSE